VKLVVVPNFVTGEVTTSLQNLQNIGKNVPFPGSFVTCDGGASTRATLDPLLSHLFQAFLCRPGRLGYFHLPASVVWEIQFDPELGKEVQSLFSMTSSSISYTSRAPQRLVLSSSCTQSISGGTTAFLEQE
jgi:hypothetical protein